MSWQLKNNDSSTKCRQKEVCVASVAHAKGLWSMELSIPEGPVRRERENQAGCGMEGNEVRKQSILNLEKGPFGGSHL